MANVRYDRTQLFQLLALWRQDDALLGLDQMEALAEWSETPDDVRSELAAEIDAWRAATDPSSADAAGGGAEA